ncbi:hybrid sensor histidine kinase/response regulator [Pseudomonas daroniae]|uniref:histidine kinase n=1 Tax=Phytopseudomonas daroniae TaxID=2487519 RepID=A0A4Q9QN73_9GAMM|nr:MULTISPECIES: hybrid sensor histidine kinase/response regulator [Pseudomonas]TBU81241.1 hybrid sensor histidine kinase/response regulator [Pseudomonas daroniae]TBU83765.1 hybrid sensor histidine kinase/response regulator [Pseudomonas sp. FRB 228]TBU89300.1 hybrid sensor histidine kinase/response regulator [Pseudomonas daroniae]
MPLEPLKLLFIEDSPRDAELALLALERHGLLVDSTLVYDHQAAELALQKDRFDLILSDYLLPGSSGAQALEVARRRAPQTPFIFLSGMFGEEHAVEMMRLGAVDYVLKQNLPFLPKAIDRAMAEVNERHERRRVEDTLQAVEARARLAIGAARMGMWDYVPATGTMIWDERCRALYELEPGADVNMEMFYGRCHPDDLPHLRQRINEALASDTGNEFQAEFRLPLSNGSERWISARGQAFFEKGQCSRFLGVLHDITEQKQANEALLRLNDMLGERVEKRTRERDRNWELSRDLLAVLRFDMRPSALNPAWEQTLGWSRQQLTQGPLWELVHADDLTDTLAQIERVTSANVSVRFVNRMRHADGDYHWLSWILVRDDDLLYAAVRDITHERAVVEELAATNQQLREQINERERVEATLQQMQRLEAVGQLTAGVAHDFNNLLTVVLTSTSFLIRDLEKGNLDKARSRLQNITDAGERGAKLTGQLLAFSRRQRLVPEAVNLGETVHGMLELLKSTLGGSVLIETATESDLWHARVDPTQIELIILNLAINARDAMAVGGTLRLGTSNEVISKVPQRPEDPEPGDYVVLSVQDSGSGMSEAVLAKAFEPFFTTKEIGKGSGLGLAQVFGFAKQSGGGARILTEMGVGTTVKVYLPGLRSVVQASDEISNQPLPVAEHGAQRTILLVDDDPRVREVTAQTLDALGYQVREANSGAEALSKLDDEIDLLLADFAMPGMNGAELAQVARQRYPELPVVFVTGYAELGGLDADEVFIVQKPYRSEELAEKLQYAFAGSKAT